MQGGATNDAVRLTQRPESRVICFTRVETFEREQNYLRDAMSGAGSERWQSPDVSDVRGESGECWRVGPAAEHHVSNATRELDFGFAVNAPWR